MPVLHPDRASDVHAGSHRRNSARSAELWRETPEDVRTSLEPETLAEAFWEIILGSRACTLTLNEEVYEGMENQCTVTVEGEDLEYQTENGWQLTGPAEIEILGLTCEAILDGTLSNIEVVCPCGVMVS